MELNGGVIGVDSAVKGIAIVSLPSFHVFIPRLKLFDDSLVHFYRECTAINCSSVWIEDVTYVRNYAATIKLAEVLAVVKLAFLERDIPVFSVNNLTWKRDVIGNGHATKEDVKRFVKTSDHFSLPDAISDDIADAACLALFGKLRMEKG